VNRKPGSDLDVLVEFPRTPTIFNYITLKIIFRMLWELRYLVMKNALKPDLGKHILNEVEAV